MIFSAHTPTHADQFNAETDRDLVIAFNEARSPAELARLSSLTRDRFATRAATKVRHAARTGRVVRGLSLRLS
jgi:hypothetical protein